MIDPFSGGRSQSPYYSKILENWMKMKKAHPKFVYVDPPLALCAFCMFSFRIKIKEDDVSGWGVTVR